LLIGSSSKEDNARFKRMAVEKLGANYDIHEVRGILPRIKVIGMTQMYKENEIIDFIKDSVKYNYSGRELHSKCAVIQVDRPSCVKLIEAGGLFI
jgi:hypothetical protein